MKSFYKRYRSVILFGLVVLITGGYYAYRQIQISLFPEITFPKIKIIADNGEQPVNKMMISVTKPLEEAVKQVPDLKTIRSTTSRGSCEISVFLDWGANIFTSQQQIESRISEIRNNLPPETHITVERMNPSILPVMSYSLESKDENLISLKQIAEYTVKPFLSQVEGVSAVRIQGGKTKEFWLEPDPVKMQELGLTPQDISTAFSTTDFIRSNGYMNTYRRLYLTITDAGLYQPSDIENLSIRLSGGRVIKVKDIGNVKVAEKIEYVKINANGHEGVLVNVLKQPYGNIIALGNKMNDKVKELQRLLPSGVTLKPIYNQSEFVKDSIQSVRDALLIGLVLAIIVAIIFLHSFHASASMLIIIPVTLCTTLLAMLGVNYTLNIMTLGAIAAAIGLIIDDAVVVVEQMHRTREEHPEVPVNQLVKKAIRFLLPAMIGSSLSTIVIFIPFSLMTGVAGAYFKILAYTMIITLVCSFLVTAIGLPALYGFVAEKIPIKIKTVHHAEKRKWVDFLIHKPWVAIGFIVFLITSAIYIIPHLETGFLPEMDEGTIVLDYDSPPGTSIEETDRMLREVDKILGQVPEVVSYSRRTGTQMGFFITEPSRGDYRIQLTKKRSRTTEQVIDDIRQRVEQQLPALKIDFGQVIGDMLGDLMASAQPIEIKVFGPDAEKLKGYAREIAGMVEHVPGTADVFNGIVIAGPYIDIRPRDDQLYRFGLTPSDLQFQLQTMLQGVIVGSVQELQQFTNIRMVFPGGPEQQADALKKTNIFLPGGRQVPLSRLADLKIHKGVSEQERENLQPIVAVTARLNGRDLGSVMTDIRKQIDENISFPKGYGVTYGGSFAEQQASFHELMIILVLASLLVLLVLLTLFRSLKAAFTILFLSIMGIGGSVLLLYLTHTPLNVGSYTGIIMIVGIIAENAIFTYQQFLTTFEPGKLDVAINFAIATRLRPKLMTALGAIIALSPLALGIGTGAQLHQPLAIAVIGGFIVALPLLLVVFPSLLRLIHGN